MTVDMWWCFVATFLCNYTHLASMVALYWLFWSNSVCTKQKYVRLALSSSPSLCMFHFLVTSVYVRALKELPNINTYAYMYKTECFPFGRHKVWLKSNTCTQNSAQFLWAIWHVSAPIKLQYHKTVCIRIHTFQSLFDTTYSKLNWLFGSYVSDLLLFFCFVSFRFTWILLLRYFFRLSILRSLTHVCLLACLFVSSSSFLFSISLTNQ